MLCRELSLVKETTGRGIAIPLVCRAWNCDYCRPMRKRQLVELAKRGNPNRLVTLTAAPGAGVSPAARAKALARAWRLVCKRIKRLHPGQPLEYLAVFEATKRGEPHLHILCRSGFIPQAWLSDQMREIMRSPIVDVRQVKNAKVAAAYVAKYIGKAPHHFATCKRYWTSKNWAASDPANERRGDEWPGVWRIVDQPLHEILRDWQKRGLDVRPSITWTPATEALRNLAWIEYGSAPAPAGKQPVAPAPERDGAFYPGS